MAQIRQPRSRLRYKGSSSIKGEGGKKDDSSTNVAGVTGRPGGKAKAGVLPYSQTNFTWSGSVKFTNKTKSLEKMWKN